jgi:molybdate-binding protein
VTGHLEVAAAIAAGLADAGIASEPAALAYDLAFVPLTGEHFDLVIPAGHEGTREAQGPAESPLIRLAARSAGQRARL